MRHAGNMGLTYSLTSSAGRHRPRPVARRRQSQLPRRGGQDLERIRPHKDVVTS